MSEEANTVSIEKLNDLRNDIKTVTQQIISLINQRMEIAKQIGEIKSELRLGVVDDRVEQEIKNYILNNTCSKGLDHEFLGRIINMLIKESVTIQNYESNKKKLLTKPNKTVENSLLVTNNSMSDNNNSRHYKNQNAYGCV